MAGRGYGGWIHSAPPFGSADSGDIKPRPHGGELSLFATLESPWGP